MCTGAQPARATAISWFERKSGPANDTEIIFYALLLCQSANSVAELDQWVQKVLSQAQRVEELGTKWTPPKEPDWQGSGGQLAPIFKYMQDAYRFGGQPNAFYDNVGAAIQSCAVEGSVDGLGCSQLRDHIKTDPQGPRDGKGRTVPRTHAGGAPYLPLPGC